MKIYRLSRVSGGITFAILASLLLTGLTGLAAADRPIAVPYFLEFPDTDPCTGVPMTVTFDGMSYIHNHNYNTVIRIQREITTTSGYEGRGSDVYVINGQIFKVTINDMLGRGPGEDRMRVHVVFVLDLSTGMVRANQFSITCLGP